MRGVSNKHCLLTFFISYSLGKSQGNFFCFKVREKSGNSVKWSGKLEILQKSGYFNIMLCQTLKNLNRYINPRGSEFFPLRAVPCGLENHFYHTWWPPLKATIFITNMRNWNVRFFVLFCSLIMLVSGVIMPINSGPLLSVNLVQIHSRIRPTGEG